MLHFIFLDWFLIENNKGNSPLESIGLIHRLKNYPIQSTPIHRENNLSNKETAGFPHVCLKFSVKHHFSINLLKIFQFMYFNDFYRVDLRVNRISFNALQWWKWNGIDGILLYCWKKYSDTCQHKVHTIAIAYFMRQMNIFIQMNLPSMLITLHIV